MEGFNVNRNLPFHLRVCLDVLKCVNHKTKPLSATFLPAYHPHVSKRKDGTKVYTKPKFSKQSIRILVEAHNLCNQSLKTLDAVPFRPIYLIPLYSSPGVANK